MPRIPRRNYSATDVESLIDVIRGRLAEGASPQGSTTGKTGAKYTGYDTQTEQKQAITGLGAYRHAEDTAVQQLIEQAAAQGAGWSEDRAGRRQTEMEAAGDKVSGLEANAADAQWGAMASNYAGASAKAYADEHQERPPPEMTTTGTGAYGGTSSVFAARPSTSTQQRLAAATDPNVLAGQQQQTAAAGRMAGLPAARQEFADTQNRMGLAGQQQRADYEAWQDQDAAVQELMYGSQTPWYQDAAVEMGVDPLVAAGMFQDTPADRINQYRQGRDLASIDENGMLYDEAQTAQQRADKEQQTAEDLALDQLVQGSTGLSSNAVQSRAGLTRDQVLAVTQDPSWSQLVSNQDQILADAQAGDEDALTDLYDLLSAPDLSIEQRRLLRARMQGLGITDTELDRAAG